MALKWDNAKHGSYIEAGNWSIHKSKDDFTLKLGWNFVCLLKTEAGCKRVANCIHREMEKDRMGTTGKKTTEPYRRVFNISRKA